MRQSESSRDIAIVGMACRFPGANNLQAYWENLCQGRESITFLSDEDLLTAGVTQEALNHPNYVKAAPILEDVEQFDAHFFEYSPREARLMDPQQRHFLEVAWEGFENAGYYPETYEGAIGVFAGSGGVVTSYLVSLLRDHPELMGTTGSLEHIGNDKDFLSTRVSYKLNLTGPSLNVQTACSTSLVAVHLACQSLIAGECDMALAGAATVRFPHKSGYIAQNGDILSPDGHCRAFDAKAEGTIFGSGVGVVILKPLQNAIADKDHIYAVIKSTAINNDGAMKVSYTASSVAGQSKVMVEALALAGISPRSLSYVECHGTGTVVGDPLEIDSLSRAFRLGTKERGFCAIGSVKTNVGHLEQTAGMAALIKTALALKHRKIPPSLNFETPNPKINFESSPFYVNTKLQNWQPEGNIPLRAGINALGLGGTNAFAVLEEAPILEPQTTSTERSLHPFNLSAKSETALLALGKRFRSFLDRDPEVSLADICYTANAGRSHFPYRFSVIVQSKDELKQQLEAFLEGRAVQFVNQGKERKRQIAFLFTGQGSQYVGMAAQLYQTQPTFRKALQLCNDLLLPYLETPLLNILFTEGDAANQLHNTAYTQPALFAVEYSLVELWRSWGVEPDAVVGHSVGEFVAACVAGVFELPDALKLIAERARLMQSLPRNGSMAAIFASEETVLEILEAFHNAPVTIAAVNSPNNTIISGTQEAVAAVLQACYSSGLEAKELNVSHAFHSPLMEPILDEFEKIAASIKVKTPKNQFISNLTGNLMETAPEPRYWREHARQAVRFTDSIKTLSNLGYEVFLEIGPGRTLLNFGHSSLFEPKTLWLPSLSKDGQDWQQILQSLQKLYLQGWSLNWNEFDRPYSPRRVPLPTYPFQGQHYWLKPIKKAISSTPLSKISVGTSSPSEHPLLGSQIEGNSSETRFEAIYNLERLPYLDHHRIYNQLVLPTTAGLEAITTAGQYFFDSKEIVIENFIYQEALIIPEDGSLSVQCILILQTNEQAAFQVVSSKQSSQEPKRVHMSGILRNAKPNLSEQAVAPIFSMATIEERNLRTIATEPYYEVIGQLGLNYGSSFRGIRELWQGKGEAFSKVCLPEHLSVASYNLHPALLDACLHIYPALVEEYGDLTILPEEGKPVFLPIGLERFFILKENLGEVWTHAKLRNQATGDHHTLVMDLRLYDSEANLVAGFEGLSLRRLPPESLIPVSYAENLYQIHWQNLPTLKPVPQPEREVSSIWLIFADQTGIGNALANHLNQAGERCHLVHADENFSEREPGNWCINPRKPEDFHNLLELLKQRESLPWKGVIYLWNLDAPPMALMNLQQLDRAEAVGTGGALFLFQALIKATPISDISPKVWLLTRNTQQIANENIPIEAVQSPLWGFGCTAALEYPQMWGGLIDLPPLATTSIQNDVEGIVREILDSDGEERVALRSQGRFGARLMRVIAGKENQPKISVRPDATYMITGGLGALGLCTAKWLVEQHGAQQLVLIGRKEAQGAAVEAVKQLESLGATVTIIKADITSEADVQRIIAEIQADLPPLKGVIHCAGSLDDSVLSNMDWQKFTRITRPKIIGGWLIHHYTQQLELDFFILFSSILSLTGSGGQANYTAGNAFLDGLAAYRRFLGLPAMVVNWGPWGEVGLATHSGSRGEAIWKRRGTKYLSPEAAIDRLQYAFTHHLEQVAVISTDWEVFIKQFSQVPSLYKELIAPHKSSSSATSNQEIRERLAKAPRSHQRQILIDFFRVQASEVLGIEGDLNITQPLGELGLDSLLSIELVNRLESSLAIKIPMLKMIQGPSVKQLVDELFPDLEGLAEAETVSREPQRLEVEHSRWVVVHKPNPNASIRLFCFSYAGGSPNIYRNWHEGLPESIEVCSILLPGRGRRLEEKPLTRISEIVEGVTTALLPYLDKPFAFFGHCMGAIVMYEITQQLRKEKGLQPIHLFSSGAFAPHLYAIPFFHLQPETKLIELLRIIDFNATKALLDDEEMRQVMLPILRADLEAAAYYPEEYYEKEPLDVNITAFGGWEDLYAPPTAVEAWQKHTRCSFELFMRPGKHYFLETERSYLLEQIEIALRSYLIEPTEANRTFSTTEKPPLSESQPKEQVSLNPGSETMRLNLCRNNSITQLDSNWFQFPQPERDAKMRFFCFPSAWGGEPDSVEWTENLPSSVELVKVNFPGWDKRNNEVPFNNLYQLIEEVTKELLPYLDKPFAFFGHSMGAIVAYETARFLRQEHQLTPVHLFVSGSPSPNYYVLPPVQRQPNETILELLHHIDYQPANKLLHQRHEQELIMPTLRTYFQAMSSYQYQPDIPLSTSITAFATWNDLWVSPLSVRNWREYTTGRFNLFMRSGHHFSLNQDRLFYLQIITEELLLELKKIC